MIYFVILNLAHMHSFYYKSGLKSTYLFINETYLLGK